MRLARTAPPLPRVVTCEKVWSAGVEPAVSGSRSRRGGHAPPRPDERTSTPGGTRTRSFRVEGPASSTVRPRGRASRRSWSRTRPCSLSASRAAADTDLRELGRQGSNLRFAINSRASYRSTTPERAAEAEGIEPPTAEAAPVFETGYRAYGSASVKWSRQASNPHRAE